MTTKRCSKCHEYKELIHFNKWKASKDGLYPSCKECVSKQTAAYRNSHKEQVKASIDKWRQDNPDKVSAATKQWKQQNKDYVKQKDKADYEQNRDERIRKVSEYRAKNKRKVKNWQLKTKFGITIDQYEALMKAQSNKCAICGRDQMDCSKQFAVDHDHETGQVRGLLCSGCNTSLGGFQESIDVLNNAIKYLLRHKG